MEHKILPPLQHESSRKRKLTGVDEWGNVSEIDLRYNFSKNSNLLHKINARLGTGDVGNPSGLLLDPKSQAIAGFEKDQFHTGNSFSSTLLSDHGTRKISKYSTSLLPNSFHHGGLFPPNKIPDGKTLTVSNGPPWAYNLFSQTEQLILPILEFGGTQAGKAEVDPGLQDFMSFVHKNYWDMDKQSMTVRYSSPEILRSSALLHQSFVDNHEVGEALEGKSCLLETRKCRTSVLKQNEPNLNTAGSSSATASLGISGQIEHTEKDRTTPNETPVGGGTQDQDQSDNLREDREGQRHSSIQMKKKTKGSHSNSSLVESVPPKNGRNLTDAVVGNYWRNENSHSSCKLSDEKSVQFAGKLASKFSDKLWDGSLRLNSSITVSTVAFFKSGEKMPNIKWSELVEVKGKVRLEAFEKYIQDLSRSRNRGLMVISLCWKEGSSKSGLVGLKKVAKGYKEGKRVGFVQLLPGIDLYVCPRSDTIITILAKHGFFKGMAAVVDKQDSLIGCVVWRRNGAASTNSGMKKSERKSCPASEQLRNSSSASSNQKSVGKDLSCAESTQKPIPVASETESTTFEGEGNSRNEGKHLKTSEVHLELNNSSASANLPLTSSFLRPQTLTCFNSAMDSASLQGSMSQSSEAEAAVIHKSGVKRSEPSSGLQNPLMSIPFDVMKQTAHTPDDDDLPEFDFGTGSGISRQMSKSLDAAIVDKTLLTVGLRKINGSLQPTVQTAHSLSAFNQQRLEVFNLPRLPLDAIQRMPPPKKACEREEETTRSRDIMVPVNAAASKSLFSDDDDMPEWCPPNVEPHKQLVPLTLASTTFVPSEVPNSTFEIFSPRYPNPMAVGHSTSTQASAYANSCSMDVTTKMVQPTSGDRFVQRGPNSSLAFSANPPVMLPPDAFAVKYTVRPGGWIGRRP